MTRPGAAGAAGAAGDAGARASGARMAWRVATVVAVRDETPRARTLVLDVPAWPGHRAGQHVDVRLVAEDGYQAQRSYSIASAPPDMLAPDWPPHGHASRIELTVERLDDGEVSPWLLDVLRPGDGVEVRGPIGGWFAWDVGDGGPLLLVAGGSGVVPLMAMLRHHALAAPDVRARVPVRLLYSVRTPGDVIYREELARLAAPPAVEIVITVTRDSALAWAGRRGRIDRALLATAFPASARPLAFACGPTPFVEAVATALVELGYAPDRVRTERFGPTGDGGPEPSARSSGEVPARPDAA